MKSRQKEGILVHMAILKWGDNYLGISKEFGLVEEALTPEEASHLLLNGARAILSTLSKNKLSLEANLSVRPPLKYYAIYLSAPLFFYTGRMVSVFTAILNPFGSIRLNAPAF